MISRQVMTRHLGERPGWINFYSDASPSLLRARAYRLLWPCRKHCGRPTCRREKHQRFSDLWYHRPGTHAEIGYWSADATGAGGCASFAVPADAVLLFRRQHATRHGVRCGRHGQSKRERPKRPGRWWQNAAGLHEILGSRYSHEQGRMALGVRARTAQD